MVFLKQLFKFYIHASIHVALAVYALTLIVLTKYNFSSHNTLAYTTFFGSIFAYNFVKFYPVFLSLKFKLNFYYKVVFVLSIISLICCSYYAFFLKFKTLIFLGFFGLITLFYVLPIRYKTTLRTIPGIKIFVIALVWSCVTVIAPLIEYNFPVSFNVSCIALQFFLLVIILMLPFEIRDLKYDGLALKTLPQVIGVKVTKRVGYVLIFILFLLEFFKTTLILREVIILGAICVLLVFVIKKSSVTQRAYYSSFFVESIPIIWFVLLHFI